MNTGKQKRNTIASRIREAKTDQEKADLAYFGRYLNWLERWSLQWISNTGILKRIHPSAPEEGRLEVKKNIENAKANLLTLFLEMLAKRDSESLRSLAGLLDILKSNPKRGDEADQFRAQLISMKVAYPEGMSLHQLQLRSGYIGELSTLKRIAEDVGFPLAEARKGRPKKAASKS